jgi:flavodoxin
LDTIAFPQSFAPLYDQLRQAQIRDRKLAVFGCGDANYPYFCGAVELLQEKIGDLGGRLIHTPLCIDGDPLQASAEILAWSKVIARDVHGTSAG